MNQHLLVKMGQLGVAHLVKILAITSDWRRGFAQFIFATE
jgi:hypothetical protein